MWLDTVRDTRIAIGDVKINTGRCGRPHGAPSGCDVVALCSRAVLLILGDDFNRRSNAATSALWTPTLGSLRAFLGTRLELWVC
jgi:hypothetical protein